jgi:hypothetical protein
MKVTDGRPYGFQVPNFQACSFELWRRFREHALGYYTVNGMCAGARLNCFFGNYPKTAFGVHIDTHHEDVFQFIVKGRKRMRLWPPDLTQKEPEIAEALLWSQKYEKYKGFSIEIEGCPGDVLYWPGGWWHIGEASERETHASISLVFERSTRFRVCDLASPHISANVKGRFSTASDPTLGDLSCHDQIVEYGDSLKEFVSDPKLELQVQEDLLRDASAMGFKYVPPPMEKCSLDLEDIIRVDPCCPILIREVNGTLIIAANGYTTSVNADAGTLLLVETLNTGKFMKVNTAVSHLEAAGFGAGDALDFLVQLVSIRALLCQ